MSYDVHYQGTEGTHTKPITFGYTAAVAVRGRQKMVNRWLKCLLTPKGTDLFDAQEGTDFTNLIGTNVSGTQDLLDALALIVQDCNDQMKAWDQRNLPPRDEQFGSATIQRIVELGGGGYDVWVRVLNAAGETGYIQLPTIGV